jgi:16S rRNA (adenine1518-N6/adenine1519-N6)-dimethyltransferase
MADSPRMRPRKRFGQHFLTQPSIARRIVSLAALDRSTRVLEIGPGTGVLTRLLAEAAREVWAIEIDRDLAARLRDEFVSQPHVHIIAGDALRTDWHTVLPGGVPVVAVANLPYNVATPVLLALLRSSVPFDRLVLMLQREVAARLVAQPGQAAYGSLSIAVQLAADVAVAFAVGAGAFTPRPKVDSAVVILRPRRPPPVSETERRAIERVVRAVFGQRRKQLVNSLGAVTPDPAAVLAALAIDPRRRPETLGIDDFVRLARSVEEAGS